MSWVNDGQLKRRLFGRLESDSTDRNQCDMRLSFPQDERFKVVTPCVQITDGALHDLAVGSRGHIKVRTKVSSRSLETFFFYMKKITCNHCESNFIVKVLVCASGRKTAC